MAMISDQKKYDYVFFFKSNETQPNCIHLNFPPKPKPDLN